MRRQLLVLTVAAGCHARQDAAKHPRPAAPQIELCKTTETQARATLGEPTRDGVFHRQHVLSWILGEDDVVRYLAVLVNDSGVIVDEVWNVPTEIPWTPTDQCADRTTPAHQLQGGGSL